MLRALEALRPEGVLGTLFPASLLSLKAAERWRERLLETGDLRFLASIGDYGLFSHALVQVAAAVFTKSHEADQELVALVTENNPQATSAALRELRRRDIDSQQISAPEEGWSLFHVPTRALKERPTWRLPTPRAERVLARLSQSGLPKVQDLFNVAQGIQTGLNDVLLLKDDAFRRLHAQEKRYFRQATMTDSIDDGRIVKRYWVFFPNGPNGPLFPDEDALRKALPVYHRQYIEPNRDRLQGRAAFKGSGRSDWWGLMRDRRRDWSMSQGPRIITKFFGAEGAFVADCDASLFAVMGHVWTPTWSLEAVDRDEDAKSEVFSDCEMLRAYVALFNSNIFLKLLSLYSQNVAGGQFDLSKRHVDPIPVPDLQQLSLHPVSGSVIRRLSSLAEAVDLSQLERRRLADKAASYLYGEIDADDL